MTKKVSTESEIPLRGEVKPPFFRVGNEVLDVFLPIMGPDCGSLHAYIVRKSFPIPKVRHSIRQFARATGLAAATVSRSLAILEHLRLVKVVRLGGCQSSEYQILDSRFVAENLGASYDPGRLSWSLPPEVAQRLTDEVKQLRQRQQGKSVTTATDGVLPNCGNPVSTVAQRNASVSPAIRQRFTRETQRPLHLLLKEIRNEKDLTPTPSQIKEKAKATADDSSGGDSAALLKLSRDRFNGVIDDLSDHLLSTSTPSHPNLANGFNDWQRFGFRNLAVEAAAWREDLLVLVLSADDPAAARRGLEKYHRKWKASLRTWFACEVTVEVQEASGRP
jgi:hypothetical protein